MAAVCDDSQAIRCFFAWAWSMIDVASRCDKSEEQLSMIIGIAHAHVKAVYSLP
jgi:hypothetical protein